jgi:predicted GIY-YIG superfamily endonuclease
VNVAARSAEQDRIDRETIARTRLNNRERAAEDLVTRFRRHNSKRRAKPYSVILRVPRVESRSFSSMQERAYFVYVMSSLSRTLYTGVTDDLERRNTRKDGSFTARYNVISDPSPCLSRERG